MRPAILLAARFPRLVTVAIATVTLLALAQLGRLDVRISAEGMQIAGDPVKAVEERVLNTFGSDSVTVIYLEDPDLFEPAMLARVRDAIQLIERSPLVERTSSLFNVTHLRNEDGFIATRPYFDGVPASRAAAEAIRDQAMQNPLVSRVLLSSDGRGLAINVYLSAKDYYRGYDDDVTRLIDDAIAPLRPDLQIAFQVGSTSI